MKWHTNCSCSPTELVVLVLLLPWDECPNWVCLSGQLGSSSFSILGFTPQSSQLYSGGTTRAIQRETKLDASGAKMFRTAWEINAMGMAPASTYSEATTSHVPQKLVVRGRLQSPPPPDTCSTASRCSLPTPPPASRASGVHPPLRWILPPHQAHFPQMTTCFRTKRYLST